MNICKITLNELSVTKSGLLLLVAGADVVGICETLLLVRGDLYNFVHNQS